MSEPQEGDGCNNCRFWYQWSEDGKEGNCHRHAPRPFMVDGESGASFICLWPNTTTEDWCWEWQPVVEEASD